LRWEYGTVPVAFSTTDTVPYLQTLRLLFSYSLSVYVSGRKDTGLLGERKKRKREKESKKWKICI